MKCNTRKANPLKPQYTKLSDLAFYEALRSEYAILNDQTVFITKSLLLGIIDKTIQVLKEAKKYQ